jgi:hypothetical protein
LPLGTAPLLRGEMRGASSAVIQPVDSFARGVPAQRRKLREKFSLFCHIQAVLP